MNQSETQSQSLAGKTALVTGGSRGIGAAIAQRLAQAGANVVITYQSNAEAADKVVAACKGSGAQARAVQCDAGDVKSGQALVADLGSLDILVNNAAVLTAVDLKECDEAAFDQNIAVNQKGVFFLTQAAAKAMGPGGRIVNIGSIFGETVPFPGIDLYSMTKFAMAGLTRAWARDLAEDGITVNCIQPGPINTDMNPEDGALAEAMLPRSPIGRYGRPEEIAEMVAYLCGPNTDNVTGSVLNNDGAWNA
ncbi:SDR family NAD(P)-dependent oxidoreductase [Thalassovita sp.]|jgi:3-oxoacyl-[acyl-carrier protein] reductase|uniref:SDR family NAD(P)-dependent oxidoreductase n=1 Tax=Thalassovita sp. TaxID=1979401 RepID=UPI003B5CA8CE